MEFTLPIALIWWTAFASHPSRVSTMRGMKAVSEIARPQGGWPAAVFYPFGHRTPYAYAVHSFKETFTVQQFAVSPSFS
jgi:hypothetical protein